MEGEKTTGSPAVESAIISPPDANNFLTIFVSKIML